MSPDAEPCLQERYAPASVCFGCGPTNPAGLRVRSFVDPAPPPGRDGALVATWTPAPDHHAFASVLNGGICGAIMDCHANWAAAMAIMRSTGADRPPATVTADFVVHLLAPTPTDQPLTLRSWCVEVGGRRATSEAHIETADGTVTATLRGHFVAVRDDHPAHDRWQAGEEPTPGAG